MPVPFHPHHGFVKCDIAHDPATFVESKNALNASGDGTVIKSFLGYGYGWLSDPNLWTPWGAPQPGDQLNVSHGIPFLGDSSFGSSATQTTINVASATSDQAILLTWNETFRNTSINNFTYADPHSGQVVIVGRVTLDAKSSINAVSQLPVGNSMTVWLYDNSQLVNQGTLTAGPRTTLDIEGGPGAATANNGNITSYGGTILVNSDVIGSGNIWSTSSAQYGGKIELGKSVGAGETIHVEQGNIQLDEPTRFLGYVDMPVSAGNVLMEGLAASSWKAIPNSSLVEMLNSSGAPIDIVNIIPQNHAQLTMTSFSGSHGVGTMLQNTYLASGAPATQGIVLGQNA